MKYNNCNIFNLPIIFSFFCSQVVYANDEIQTKAYQYIDCSAYYSVLAGSYRENGGVDSERKIAYRQSVAITLAIDLVDKYEFEERSNIALQYMVDVFFSKGVEELTMQYGKFCDNLLKNNTHNIQDTIALKSAKRLLQPNS